MIRQQAISAIHAKVLRLNSASVAAVSVGQVSVQAFLECHSKLHVGVQEGGEGRFRVQD